MRRLLASLAVLATLVAGSQAQAAFKPGDEVSYTAGGGVRTGYVLSKAGTRDLYLVSRNGSDSTQHHLPGSRLTLRSADEPGLEQRVNQLAASLASLEGAVDQLEARVDGLEPDPPPPSPSTVGYVAPTDGQTVSGVTPVRTRAPAGTDWIGVYSGSCPGNSIGEDQAPDANGEWSVQWDTTACQNASRASVETFAFKDDGTQLGSKTIFVTIQNEPQTPPPPPPPLPPPSGEPGPIAGQGYSRVFADEFATLDRSVWSDHAWYEPAAPAGSQTVANGELRLRRTRSTGFANTTMSTEPLGSNANPKSFKYGYFEARMRYETVQGNGPAFWLFSTRHATNPGWPNINPLCALGGQFPKAECLSAELDVFEGYGRVSYGGSRQDDFYTATIHRNSSGHYGEANQSRHVQHGCGCDFSQYHVFGVRWTATEVSFYLDGQLQGTVQPFDSFNQPMHLYLYNWTTGWAAENVPNASTENELDTFVDWVRVWQK